MRCRLVCVGRLGFLVLKLEDEEDPRAMVTRPGLEEDWSAIFAVVSFFPSLSVGCEERLTDDVKFDFGR